MAETALRPALRNGLVLFGTGIILAMVLLAAFAGVVAPYDPTDMKVADALKRPSLAHPFGTDRFGRDVLSRTIYGSRIALGVAISSIGIALVIGTILGLLGGYLGGATDLVIGRAMDVLFSFPTLILAIGIAAMLGPGLDNAALAIAVVYAPLFSRVVRGPVIAERAKEYALAALGLGAGGFRVVCFHILPNVLAPLIVQASVSLAYAILTEAALSYLGLGTQPPAPSWGTMLNEGRTYLETAPWMSIFPGLAIMLAVLGFNLLGDGLRAALDPQLRGR
ncbi:MAG TPA: ABC transporter permease [Candidatus Acidoferrum sp.]|jgi:peptide/nickel transport system permease protein|nr:ABC transporter permease [Candidatus Acidoferrum sp.]